MKLRVIVHKAEEGGFWAEAPALPGCVSQGESLEAIRQNIQEAIELWLEAGNDQVGPVGQEQIMELVV